MCVLGPLQKAAAAGAPPEEREDDDAEGDGAEAGASFDYLLSMPIHSLTHEKVRPACCCDGRSITDIAMCCGHCHSLVDEGLCAESHVAVQVYSTSNQGHSSRAGVLPPQYPSLILSSHR